MNIILKTVERCNIGCRYCYFFRGADQSHTYHPATISRTVIESFAQFIIEGVQHFPIRTLAIVFHGGEPLLQKKADFDWMCEHLHTTLHPHVEELRFGIQTNATLIDSEWIDLFGKHSVAVGVSVDGPPTVNDAHRVDFQGRGTYGRTLRGIQLLQRAIAERRLPYALGAIAVIDPATCPADVLDHFVDTLGIRTIHFELPDLHFDSVHRPDVGVLGHYLCGLFDAWARRDDPSIYIRIISSVLAKWNGQSSALFTVGTDPQSLLLDYTELTIASNGDIGADDGLRSTGFWRLLPSCNVQHTSLADYLRQPQFSMLRHARSIPPSDCRDCLWESTCGGGPLINRWSHARSFDNRSVYCEGLKQLYAHMAVYLARHGVPPERIARWLALTGTDKLRQVHDIDGGQRHQYASSSGVAGECCDCDG